jgi:hypothetical protein
MVVVALKEDEKKVTSGDGFDGIARCDFYVWVLEKLMDDEMASEFRTLHHCEKVKPSQ